MPKSVTFDTENVMENVMELFWRKGYNGTSMQELVNATGLNRSSLYNTYGDKFSLFEQALKHYQNKQNQALKKTFGQAQSPKNAIISLFRGIGSDILEGDNKGCMISACTAELSNESDRIRDFLVTNKDRLVASFQALIEGAQALGEIERSKDSKSLALFLFSSLQGLRLTAMIEPRVEGIVDNILENL
ncbi:MAG: TetR/AcrR family transcriptional regulator [Ekhidna sp.]|nr:TetR/AcrR family transcriptional regulator [Ekhidna sp.]